MECLTRRAPLCGVGSRYRGNPPAPILLCRATQPPTLHCSAQPRRSSHHLGITHTTLPPSSAILCSDTLKRLDGEKGVFSLCGKSVGIAGWLRWGGWLEQPVLRENWPCVMRSVRRFPRRRLMLDAGLRGGGQRGPRHLMPGQISPISAPESRARLTSLHWVERK